MRFVLLLMLLGPVAHAETWEKVADLDKQGGALLVDMSGVSQAGDERTAWSKTLHDSDQRIPADFARAPNAVFYRWEVTLNRFNCADRTSSKAETILVGADDKVVAKSSAVQKAPKPRQVSRGSAGEKLLEKVCSVVVPPAPPASTSAPGSESSQPVKARLIHAVNPDDYYPRSAVRRGEQGSPILKVCVGPTGALLREPEITDSSGFPELDAAGIQVAKANQYAAAIEQGVAVAESCIRFKVNFVAFHH